jgi:hypothetical protein
MSTIIRLSWYEIGRGADIGVRRHLWSISRGYENRHGKQNDEDTWTTEIEGVCGEMAVAKFLDVYYAGHIDTFKKPDIEPDIQVRTALGNSRYKRDLRLIVREYDKNKERFVLVVAKSPVYHLGGWVYGHEAKNPNYLEGSNGRTPAYFVGQRDLRDMRTLIVYEQTTPHPQTWCH